MGHTLASTTQLVYEQIAEIKPLYDALRRGDQLILDKFFEDVLQHRAAIGNAASLLPITLVPIVILLEERKRNNKIHNELYGRIEELEKRLGQSGMEDSREIASSLFLVDTSHYLTIEPANDIES